MALSIHTDDFQTLLDSLEATGYRCVAPVKVGDISKYEPVERASDIFLGEIQTTKSPKEYFLAEHEAILNYKRKSKTS
ncbi:MAG: hypothetical protein NTY09_11090, partial [bacterium]|nr:hypothetical protein [bacterium]